MATYRVTITINDADRIVNVDATAEHLPNKHLRLETAWAPEGADVYWTARHPDDGHEIMTYEDRDQAIGEALTSLRDTVDADAQYRE